jgi:RNA polymerase sigma factor (sigma-70 family)
MIGSTPSHNVSSFLAHRDFASASLVLPVLGPADAITERVDAILTRSALAAKLGNLAARNALYLALQPKLLYQARTIRSWMLPPSWERSDLEQEAFVVFAQLICAWKGDGSFTAYALGRFVWRLRDAVKDARDRERLPAARVETAYLIEDDSVAAEEARVLLEEVASHFPSIEQQILLGRIRDDEGFGALAHRLGVSRRTIYRHWIVIVIALRRSFGLSVDLPDGWVSSTRRRATNRWKLHNLDGNPS